VWILVQQLLPKRNSQSWEPNRIALAYEPWNMAVKLRGRCRLTDKLSVLTKPRHARRIGSHYLDAESSVSSIFIARGYLRSNAQNRHPFHHLPVLLSWPMRATLRRGPVFPLQKVFDLQILRCRCLVPAARDRITFHKFQLVASAKVTS